MYDASATAPVIAVYLRELVPNPNRQVDAFLDQLDHLAETGAIAEVTVEVVGKQVCPETAALTESGRSICHRVREFRQWAERADKQLDTVFPTTNVDNTFTGAEYRTISFPTIAMAEYVDGDLQFVTPCADGDATITPRDRLDDLTAGTHHLPATSNL